LSWDAPILPSVRLEKLHAKVRGLVLLAAVSLSCAGFAWAQDRDVFFSVFAALGTVAVLGAQLR
jgi:hypothetical protein